VQFDCLRSLELALYLFIRAELKNYKNDGVAQSKDDLSKNWNPSMMQIVALLIS